MEKSYGNEILEAVYESFVKKGRVVKLPEAKAWIVNYPGGPYDSPCHIFSVYTEAVIVEVGGRKWLISLGRTNGYRYADELYDILAVEFSEGDDVVRLIGQNYEHRLSLVYVEPINEEIESEIREIKRFLEDRLNEHIVQLHYFHLKKEKDGYEMYVRDSTKYNKDSLPRSLFNFFMIYLKNKKP